MLTGCHERSEIEKLRTVLIFQTGPFAESSERIIPHTLVVCPLERTSTLRKVERLYVTAVRKLNIGLGLGVGLCEIAVTPSPSWPKI